MRAVILLVAVLFISCGPAPEPEPVPPNPPVEPATCGDFCDHGRELGCDWVEPTAKGTTCEEVCEDVQNSGVVSWDLNCRVAAKLCEDVDRCER